MAGYGVGQKLRDALAEAAHHQSRKSLCKRNVPAKINRGLLGPSPPPPPTFKNAFFTQIQSLCKHGHLDRALETLSHLHIPPSPAIYASLLKACSRLKALPQAECILQHIARHNIELPSSISDYLVVTLAKCGNADVACHMFVLLPHRTTFSWTAIISAFIECAHGKEALDIYRFMQADGVEADSFTYASLFKACGSVLDLEYGVLLHAEACKKGFASDMFVNNTLVSMYGKCKAILEAENVFSRSAYHDVISWNAMLSTYVEWGQWKKALLCYRQMQGERANLDKHTVVFALQACAVCALEEEACVQGGQEICRMMCLEIGAALHAGALRKGFGSDIFVGTALLCMYGRCGSMVEAKSVFCMISEHDIVVWNALFSIYNEGGHGEELLQLYVYLQRQAYVPDRLTCMLAFQACSTLADKEESLLVEGRMIKLRSLEIGKALHVDADRRGYASGGFVCNAILNMYVKCGGIAEAEDVFCSLSQRDTVSWGVMISAYIEQDQIEKSLQLYRQMQDEGVRSDHCVYMSAARACGMLAESGQTLSFEGSSMKAACLEIGQALHANVQKGVFATNTFLNTTLLSMYSKCSALEQVEYVIASMSQLDTISWNALLSAYLEHNQGEKVLQAYIQMLRDGLYPDEVTYACALQACSILAENDGVLNICETAKKSICLEIGQALYKDASNLGLPSNTFISTALLTMCGKCGFIENVEDAFSALPDPDIAAWNAMLSVLVEHGQEEKVLFLYQDMQRRGVKVNDVTFVHVLSACSNAGSLEACKQLHCSIVAAGHESISSVSSTLAHAYGNCGNCVDSQIVCDNLCKPDLVSRTAGLAAHASKGDFSACIRIFKELKLEGVRTDEVMLTSVMSACSRAGHVIEGLEFFRFMKECGLGQSLKHYGIVVELLGRAGDYKRLEDFLGVMEVEADMTLWMCLLGSCHTHGNVELAKQTFSHVSKVQSTLAMPYVLMANIFAEAESTTEGG